MVRVVVAEVEVGDAFAGLSVGSQWALSGLSVGSQWALSGLSVGSPRRAHVLLDTISAFSPTPCLAHPLTTLSRLFSLTPLSRLSLTATLSPHPRRAGEMTAEEVERLVTIIQNPRQFKVPDWMLNRKKDIKDGKFSQAVSNTLDMKLRDDLERMKKIRAHRGLRHYWGLRVRGQRTKTTGRKGRTVGVSKKKG